MTSSDRQICLLPDEVVLQIASSTAISSLDAVVLGLTENALDAGASKVDISIDFARGSCTVDDDGDGIAAKEFEYEGGLGKRFCTSKFGHGHQDYGQYGTFLSSVAALSTLTITSRQSSSRRPSTLILHHSRPARRISDTPVYCSLPSHLNHGTRVTVQNLFGNMPVRILQRATSPSRAAKIHQKSMRHLKRKIVALLLSFHLPVLVTLHLARDEGNSIRLGAKLDAERSNWSRSYTNGPRAEFSKQHKRTLDTSLICRLLTHAQYIEPSEWDGWIKTSACTSDVTATGAISLHPAPSKNIQFLSLGHRPLDQEDGGSFLFEEVNRLFAASNFGCSKNDFGSDERDRTKDTRFKQTGFTQQQLRVMGKGVDRWPMFYIRIDFHNGSDPKILERDGVLNKMSKVLSTMICGFLQANNFCPRSLSHKTHERRQIGRNPDSPVSERQSPDFFSSWSRIKSSDRRASIPKLYQKPEVNEIEVAQRDQVMDEIRSSAPKRVLLNSVGEEIIEWTNPVTKITSYINSRTGLVVPRPGYSEVKKALLAPEETSSAPSSPTGRVPFKIGSSRHGEWINEVLSKWTNPVFPLPQEDQIPCISSESPIVGTNGDCHHKCASSVATSNDTFTRPCTNLFTKLSKKDLRNARFISQVDRKFLLVSISTLSNLLVLIDQHAADERIRFEDLMRNLTARAPESLPTPLNFELPIREQELFAEHSAFFRSWGIHYEISEPNKNGNYNTCLVVKSLPNAIAERCRADPKLLIHLLRSEVWKLADSECCYVQDHHHNDKQTLADGASQPMKTLPPQGITDMLSSRACRSAIMFNDELSIAEAEVLIRKLADCDLPFQCAHGRPSMVPLVDIGPVAAMEDVEETSAAFSLGPDHIRQSELAQEGEAGETSFADAWRKWQSKEHGSLE